MLFSLEGLQVSLFTEYGFLSFLRVIRCSPPGRREVHRSVLRTPQLANSLTRSATHRNAHAISIFRLPHRVGCLMWTQYVSSSFGSRMARNHPLFPRCPLSIGKSKLKENTKGSRYLHCRSIIISTVWLSQKVTLRTTLRNRWPLRRAKLELELELERLGPAALKKAEHYKKKCQFRKYILSSLWTYSETSSRPTVAKEETEKRVT